MPTLIRRSKGRGNVHTARGIKKASFNRGWTQVVCCASGPSFSAAQAAQLMVARLRDPQWRVIAVNTSYQRVRTADILYSGDRSWWEVHIEAVRTGFAGECWTINRAAAHHLGLSLVEQSDEPGLSRVNGRIHTGGNSGYAAIGLAYLMGAREILLVGYDFQDTGGMSHWHGDHPPQLNQDRPHEGWLKRLPPLIEGLQQEGVRVINCTTETAIPATVIPRGDLALCLLRSEPHRDPQLALAL